MNFITGYGEGGLFKWSVKFLPTLVFHHLLGKALNV